MTQPTGHQFEDILQCAIPAFEGLLPSPHNEIVLDLLFSLAMWHGLAKLRMHTDETLTLFEDATTTLGAALRRFKRTTCEVYYTREIDTKSLGGKKSKGKSKGQRLGAKPAVDISAGSRSRKGKGKGKEIQADEPVVRAKGTKKKELNLETAKVHKIAHYPFDIRRFGTTDSTSTQMVIHLLQHFFYLSHI